MFVFYCVTGYLGLIIVKIDLTVKFYLANLMKIPVTGEFKKKERIKMNFKKFAKLIMIEQTLFALPFAYIGMLYAGGGKPSEWLWATLALFGARTAGMSFNRVLDADIDAKNPRTDDRLIPSGELTKTSVWVVSLLSCLILIGSSFMLNRLCFYLSFAAVVLLFTYSLFKRFSSTSHFYLGFVEAAAPIGGFLAVTGEFALVAFVPGIAIMFWIAGLDIIYSIQDEEFDRGENLHSVPARFGKKKALIISSVSYLLAIAALAAGGVMARLGTGYWVGTAVVAVILMKQQSLAKDEDEDFLIITGEVFKLNRLISPVLFTGMLIDLVMKLFDIYMI